MNRFAAFFLALVCIAFLIQPEFARSQGVTSDFGFHTSPFTYQDSGVKTDGFSAGFYTNLGIGQRQSLETDIAYTLIGMDGLDDLREWDYTALYSHGLWNFLLRGGLHFVSSNYDVVDGAVTLAGGAGYEVNRRWDVFLDGYFTSYNDEYPDLKIYQLTPTAGIYLFKTPDSGFRIQARGYFIRNESDSIYFYDDNYLSAESEISWYHGSLTLRGFGWAGEQLFPVKERGFVRYNLPDLLQGGYGAGIDYRFGSGIRMSFETAAEFLEEPGNDEDSTLIRLGLVLGRNF